MQYRIMAPGSGGFEMQFYADTSDKVQEKRDYPAHIHDCLEVYLLVQGDVSFLVEGHLYHLQAGDAVISKPNELHNCILNTASPHRHFCFWFDAAEPFFFERFLRHDPGEGNLISPEDPQVRAGILSVAAQLLDAAENGGEMLLQYAKAVELLALWQQNLACAAGSDLPDVLQMILRDIEQDLPHIRRLSYFTEKYFISFSTLGRLFRVHLGTSPKAYLEDKRLALARARMRAGARVNEACDAAGFGDLSDFIRSFRRRFGITPAVYRREGDAAGALASNIYITRSRKR